MDNKNRKNVRGFNLWEIIVIIIVTGVFTALSTGLIVTSNYKTSNGMSYADLNNDTNLRLFLDSYASILDEYYEDVDKTELINNAIRGMMSYLGDKYSVYMDEDETNMLVEDLAGEYVGIGVGILYNNETNETIINEVYKDTPASNAGVMTGDVIKKINGEDVSNKDINTITSMIKQENKELTLTLLRGEELFDVKLSAKKILKPATVTNIYNQNAKNIGYLKIERFSASIYEQVKRDLEDLEKNNLSSLVIDLRDNTGGYLDGTENIAKLFLEKGKTIYSLEDKNGLDTVKDNTNEKRNYKIVILINGSSASASEILAGALKDSYGAILVGEKSYGKGKVQHAKNLTENTIIKYTSAKWLRPNGSCIDGIGIEPDYKVSIDKSTLPDLNKEGVTEEEINTYNNMINAYYEEQLNKALEIASN